MYSFDDAQGHRFRCFLFPICYSVCKMKKSFNFMTSVQLNVKNKTNGSIKINRVFWMVNEIKMSHTQ